MRHYGQAYGEEARRDTYDSRSINLAAYFTDDAEANTEIVMNAFALEKSYEEYRNTGVHRIQLDIPEKTVEVNCSEELIRINLPKHVSNIPKNTNSSH